MGTGSAGWFRTSSSAPRSSSAPESDGREALNQGRPSVAPDSKRLHAWLFATAAAVLLLLQQGAVTTSDGATMFGVTRSIVETHSMTVSRDLGIPGRDNSYYSRYGPALSLVAVPAVGAAAIIGGIVNSKDNFENFAAASMMPLISAGLLVALFALSRRLGGSRKMSLLVAVGAIAGTYFLPYTKDYFAEPLTALGLVLCFERFLAHKPAQSGAWLALAFLARPQTLVLVPVFGVLVWRSEGLRCAVRAAIPLVAGGIFLGLYNIYRFGSVLKFGYEDVPLLSTPFLQGANGLLFDPAKSVFIFAPVLVVVPFAIGKLWRRHTSVAILLTTNFLLTFALSAVWFSWQGGWAWGPRLLIPGVIPLVATLAPWLSSHKRVAIVGMLLGLGFVVSASTLLVSTHAQQLSDPLPENGPLVLTQYRLVPNVVAYSESHLFDNQSQQEKGSHRRYLNLWQVSVVRALGRKGLAVSVAGTTVLLAITLYGARRVGQELKADLCPSLRDGGSA